MKPLINTLSSILCMQMRADDAPAHELSYEKRFVLDTLTLPYLQQ